MLHSPAGAEPPRQTTRNPISLRLYKVLGTNYGDPSTRDALLSISKFYSTQPAAGDGGDQTKHGELAARARKNLRRDLDNRLADGSQQFLRAFQGVDEVRECNPACAHSKPPWNFRNCGHSIFWSQICIQTVTKPRPSFKSPTKFATRSLLEQHLSELKGPFPHLVLDRLV